MHATAARPSPTLSPLAMTRVRAHIDAHLCDAISLEDLAAAACISRFHFARLFRATTGSSPMQYVRLARITAAMAMLARARQELAAPDLSTIAVELGFFDQSHFTRAFRRVAGMPPGRFTRMCAANHEAGAP